MFDWFKKRNDNVIQFPARGLPEPREYPKMPEIEPIKTKPYENYRVGFDSDGNTTLTLMADSGSSITMSMNQAACKHLIKMLESTFTDDEDEQ